MENSSSSCSSESDSEGCGYLVFFMKKGEQSYTLVEGETTIGSSVDADIRLMPQTAPIHYCSIDVNEYGIVSINFIAFICEHPKLGHVISSWLPRSYHECNHIIIK